jgi:hypothetical protein
MKRLLEAMVVAALLLSATAAHATPSTVVWTPATTYTQPFLVPHITYDTYFGERAGFPTDVGLTMGFVPDNKFVEGEVGVDGFYDIAPNNNKGLGDGRFASQNAFQFNGKLSLKEAALFAESPALSVGGMNLGLTKNYNDFNIVYAVLGKTLGAYGQIGVGYYQGNDKLLLKIPANPADATKKAANGFMASYASPKYSVGSVGLKDISVGVDYMSGDSAFGAGAAAVTFYFNDAVSLLTGPVIFNNKYSATGGATNFLWTVQLDVDIDFAKPKPAPKT